MAKDLFIQKEYRESHSFAGLRLQHTCLASLQKWEFANLSAPVWRWYYHERPGAFIVVNKTTIPLEPGRVFLIPPYTQFSSGIRNPIQQLYMHFSLNFKRTPLPGSIFSHVLSSEEKKLVSRLIRALKEDDEKAKLEISILSPALVHLALLDISAEFWGGQLPDRRIGLAIETIHAEGLKGSGNRILAQKVGMNVNAFTRLFKQVTGHSPHQYLLRLRLEKACQLLQHSNASLEAIADETGFCDRFHLSRSFKQNFKTSPATFRRRASIAQK